MEFKTIELKNAAVAKQQEVVNNANPDTMAEAKAKLVEIKEAEVVE